MTGQQQPQPRAPMTTGDLTDTILGTGVGDHFPIYARDGKGDLHPVTNVTFGTLPGGRNVLIIHAGTEG